MLTSLFAHAYRAFLENMITDDGEMEREKAPRIKEGAAEKEINPKRILVRRIILTHIPAILSIEKRLYPQMEFQCTWSRKVYSPLDSFSAFFIVQHQNAIHII